MQLPSDALVHIIRDSERYLRMRLDKEHSPDSLSKVCSTLAFDISQEVQSESWFTSLYDLQLHGDSATSTQHHLRRLTNSIVNLFIDTRVYHITKLFNNELVSKGLRQKRNHDTTRDNV